MPLDAYEELARLTPVARANRLPRLVRQIAERNGYDVRVGAGGARPRDADLVAATLDETLLIEIKSGDRPAGLNEVDSLNARLDGMAHGVIGVVMSRSGFTRGAVERVETRRRPLILLIDGSELAALWAGDSLRAMIQAKRQALIRDGKMPFYGGGTVVTLPAQEARLALPAPASRALTQRNVIVAHGDSDDFVFVDSIPDDSWTTSLGRGVVLDLDIPIRRLDELAGVFEVLRRGSWISAAGRYAIHQTRASWHGFGATSFLEALTGLSDRYAALPDVQMHNEEHATYADLAHGGFWTLHLRVISHEEPWIFDARLSAQLPGMPLDPSSLRVTLHGLGLGEAAWLRPLRDTETVATFGFRADRIPLESLAFVVAADEPENDIVSGLITANPFRARGRNAAPEPVTTILGTTDTLIVSLGSWFSLDRAPASFSLRSIEIASTADARLLRVVADW